MGPGMFDGLGTLLVAGAVVLAISVPLAAWKLGEMIWWAFHHVHFS